MQNNKRDFQDFLEHLTNNARHSLQKSENIANKLGSTYVGTEHLLLGLLSQEKSFGSNILQNYGITLNNAQLAVKTDVTQIKRTADLTKGLSEAAKLTLRTSWEIAKEFKQEYCGTEHILYSLLIQKNSKANILLRDLNVNISGLISELEQYLSSKSFEYANGKSAPHKSGSRDS